MQDLIIGETYEGLLTTGPCEGTTCLATYLGKDLTDRLNKFKVLEEVFFGNDPFDVDFDGWWHKDDVVMLGTDWWVFTPVNLIEANE